MGLVKIIDATSNTVLTQRVRSAAPGGHRGQPLGGRVCRQHRQAARSRSSTPPRIPCRAVDAAGRTQSDRHAVSPRDSSLTSRGEAGASGPGGAPRSDTDEHDPSNDDDPARDLPSASRLIPRGRASSWASRTDGLMMVTRRPTPPWAPRSPWATLPLSWACSSAARRAHRHATTSSHPCGSSWTPLTRRLRACRTAGHATGEPDHAAEGGQGRAADTAG